MDVSDKERAENKSSTKERLDRMADMYAAFEREQIKISAPAENNKPTHIMYSDAGILFYKLCYDDHWVDMSFPWVEWKETAEAKRLISNRDAIKNASSDQLSMLLTTIIRNDRFSDGELEHAYDVGIISSILQRVKDLARAYIETKSRHKKSKNFITIEQIETACRHAEELRRVGVSENLAIRTVELFTDVYAKMLSGGSATPHHVNQVKHWSLEALRVDREHPGAKPKDHFRVEHGTPKRAFARRTVELYRKGELNAETLNELVRIYWKLAVITLEEDSRLNKIARSSEYETPDARWQAAGIKFPS